MLDVDQASGAIDGRLGVLDRDPPPRECLHALLPGPMGGARHSALQVGALLPQRGIVPADRLGRCHLSVRELLPPMQQRNLLSGGWRGYELNSNRHG